MGNEKYNFIIAKIDKLEAEKEELVEALMRIAFEVPCCAREEAREVLVKIKSEAAEWAENKRQEILNGKI